MSADYFGVVVYYGYVQQRCGTRLVTTNYECFFPSSWPGKVNRFIYLEKCPRGGWCVCARLNYGGEHALDRLISDHYSYLLRHSRLFDDDMST